MDNSLSRQKLQTEADQIHRNSRGRKLKLDLREYDFDSALDTKKKKAFDVNTFFVG